MPKDKDKNKNKLKQKEGDDIMAVAKEVIENRSSYESLKQGLKEMKLISEGKLPKETLKDFLKELGEDDLLED